MSSKVELRMLGWVYKSTVGPYIASLVCAQGDGIAAEGYSQIMPKPLVSLWLPYPSHLLSSPTVGPSQSLMLEVPAGKAIAEEWERSRVIKIALANLREALLELGYGPLNLS